MLTCTYCIWFDALIYLDSFLQVTQGTVDEDIYSVQERKAKMNEAIMEEKGGKKKKSSKSDESEEIARIMNAAVDRFLKSPTRQSDVLTQPVINVDD